MLGWSATIYRGGTVGFDGNSLKVIGGQVLLSIPPTPDLAFITPIKELAIETLSSSGYPSIFRMYVRDLFYKLDAPDDEVVLVEAWDQS